jgi:hypothetical protein
MSARRRAALTIFFEEKTMSLRTSSGVEKLKQDGKQAARQVARSPWVEPVMRLGFISRGVLYALIGLLAIRLAIGGQGGQLTDQQGALATIGAQPFGHFLLIVTAVGLVGYALWGLIRAILDPLHKGSDAKGLVNRAGYLLSAISYGGLLLPTLRLIQNKPGGAQSGAQAAQGQQAAASILTKPWGPWVIGAIGLGIVGAGIGQIATGLKAKFELSLDPYALSEGQRRWATRLGRIGYVARGIVFAITGIFLVQAARLADPNKVRGIDGALRELATQPYGWLLLAIIAAGLIAFGAYSIIGGLWFRFKKS